MKRKSNSGIAAMMAAMFLMLGLTATSNAQDDDQLVNDLKGIAAKAQSYYTSQGNSSFSGFALSADDTGNADGSFSISAGDSAPTGAEYVPGSTNAADQSSAQTLYIIGCGKTVGKDGVNPTKVYVIVTPTDVTVTDLN